MSGHASAVATLAGFGSAARGDPIYEAGVQLGRLLRTASWRTYNLPIRPRAVAGFLYRHLLTENEWTPSKPIEAVGAPCLGAQAVVHEEQAIWVDSRLHGLQAFDVRSPEFALPVGVKEVALRHVRAGM